MVRAPTNYFLHCSDCGWEVLQRSLPCEPSAKELERSYREKPKDGRCPRCGNDELIIRSANNFKGRVLAFLKGYR